MNWAADRKKGEAVSDCGYRITWSRNKFGMWFNAYDKDGKHIEGCYGGEKCKAACVAHAEKTGADKGLTPSAPHDASERMGGVVGEACEQVPEDGSAPTLQAIPMQVQPL